jgi:hypothetical protein
MPKPTKQKQAGSPKLQLGLGKGILKQRTLLETPKQMAPTEAKAPPPVTAMAMDDNDDDDDDDWPKLTTATPMDIQGTSQDPTMPHIANPIVENPTQMAEDKDSTKTKQGQVTPPSETLPVRKSVGFGASNTVVEEVLADNGESVTAICKQLAPVFANMAKRKTTLFIKVKLTVEAEQTNKPNQRGSHKTEGTRENPHPAGPISHPL